jgi:catechol 2,3-dioxygenase
MTTQTKPVEKTEFSIHPQTRMGHISLAVANLDNQLEFYQKAMGFKLHWREGNSAGLGAGGADILLLTEEPNLK